MLSRIGVPWGVDTHGTNPGGSHPLSTTVVKLFPTHHHLVAILTHLATKYKHDPPFMCYQVMQKKWSVETGGALVNLPEVRL